MTTHVKQAMLTLYEAMLEVYSMDLESFKTKITEQDPKFQGAAKILNEGLYAFENLDFEEPAPDQQFSTAGITGAPQVSQPSAPSTPTSETSNDNQNTSGY